MVTNTTKLDEILGIATIKKHLSKTYICINIVT